MNEYLAECLSIFKENQKVELSPKTIARKSYEVEKFLTYLESRGLSDLRGFDITLAYS